MPSTHRVSAAFTTQHRPHDIDEPEPGLPPIEPDDGILSPPWTPGEAESDTPTDPRP